MKSTHFARPILIAPSFRLVAGLLTDRGVQIFMAVVAAHACALAALPGSQRLIRNTDPVTITLLQAPAPSPRAAATHPSAQPSLRSTSQAVERTANIAPPESSPTRSASSSSDSIAGAATTSPATDSGNAPAAAARTATTAAYNAVPVVAPVTPPRFDAAYLDNPAPAYPAAARRLGEQGRVVLRVHVSADGLPRDIETAASSGSQRLDSAARTAVERWRFVPARQGEQTVAAWVLVPLTFTLGNS